MIPEKSGFLAVGENHELYFEAYGNPQNPAVLFLHGGPGLGFSEKDFQFFDFEKNFVIFFDQRGAGKSIYSGPKEHRLKHNTTEYLGQDVLKVLDHFEVKKACLFGGSWGSTLALVFAIQHPEKVSGMILRGIYLPTLAEDDFLMGNGLAYFFPDDWTRLMQNVPDFALKRACSYLFDQMNQGDEALRQKIAFDFNLFEWTLAHLFPDRVSIQKALKENPCVESAELELYYLAHGCFLPKNYILEHANELEAIPISLIHGRYDAICPPLDAFRLHKKLPHSRLQFPIAGHASSDPEMKKELMAEMDRFSKEIL